jgi:hypothetical protein
MAGNQNAFGLYIHASLHSSQPYCVEAKHRLYLCLDHIAHFYDREKLIAIYFDINCGQTKTYAAFQQMVKDIKLGMFSKVICFDLADLVGDPFMKNQLENLTVQHSNLECFDLFGNLIQSKSIPLNQLLGV